MCVLWRKLAFLKGDQRILLFCSVQVFYYAFLNEVFPVLLVALQCRDVCLGKQWLAVPDNNQRTPQPAAGALHENLIGIFVVMNIDIAIHFSFSPGVYYLVYKLPRVFHIP